MVAHEDTEPIAVDQWERMVPHKVATGKVATDELDTAVAKCSLVGRYFVAYSSFATLSQNEMRVF